MNKSVDGALTKASQKYSETLTVRAGVQTIPWVGSALDTLLSGKGAKINQKRIDDFLLQLNGRLQKVENAQEIKSSEEFFDLMMGVFDGVIRTRSESKRGHFASLVAHQVYHASPWDEAEAALQVITELSDAHIQVLHVALQAPPCDETFAGLRIVTTKDDPIDPDESGCPTQLSTFFPKYGSSALRLICSQLVARGLLHDEGIGRLGTKAMEYFIATETAQWLMSWIETSWD